jgi:hypothetical protein
LADAAVKELSDDRRFATAYKPAVQAAKMAIAGAGYRLAATPGHHGLMFEAAGRATSQNDCPSYSSVSQAGLLIASADRENGIRWNDRDGLRV